MNSTLPELDAVAFIAGRAAQPDDVRSGHAIFHTNNTGGEAADVDIPQYAIWKETPDLNIPVILVQAEHAPQENTVIVGLRGAEGKAIIARLNDLQLLGKKRPN